MTSLIAEVPYGDLLGAQDPLAVLASTPGQIEVLTRGWDLRRWCRTSSLAKWNASQLVLHLVQDEIGWGSRVRLALTQDGYVAQPYDGEAWVALESRGLPETARSAFGALRRLNLTLYEGLTVEQRGRLFGHPLLGDISIDWIIHRAAGHDLHHLVHLRAIADQ